MNWIASPEKDASNDALEKRLWAAADQLRANSGLTAQQYSAPVLGLIFLRFAEVRFDKRHAELQKSDGSSRRGSRVKDPAAYHAEGILYLSEKARFATLLNLPEGADVGKAINDGMADIEKHNTQLAGWRTPAHLPDILQHPLERAVEKGFRDSSHGGVRRLWTNL